MKKTLLALMLLAFTGAASAQDAKKPAAADADAKPKAAASASGEAKPKAARAAGGGAELNRLCTAEARDKKMAGGERTRFMRSCMRNEVAAEGSSTRSSSGSSAGDSAGSASGTPATSTRPTMRNPDPDGRPMGSRGPRTDAGGPRPGDTNTRK